VIDGLHGEVPGHELAHGTQTGHGSANSDAGKAHLCDWRVDDALVAVLLPQSTGNLKRALND